MAFEAAYEWGWLVELLDDYGFEAHLVHPTRCNAIAAARLKNDKVDAATLAQLLRADLLPEGWIAPPPSVSSGRCCDTAASWRSCGPCSAPGSTPCWPDYGYDRPGGCWSGPGRAWLATLDLPDMSRRVIEDNLALLDGLVGPINASWRPTDTSWAWVDARPVRQCQADGAALQRPSTAGCRARPSQLRHLR